MRKMATCLLSLAAVLLSANVAFASHKKKSVCAIPEKLVYVVAKDESVGFYVANPCNAGKVMPIYSRYLGEQVSRAPLSQLVAAQLSPGGDRIAYKFLPGADLTAEALSSVWVMDLYGAARHIAVPAANRFVWTPDGSSLLFSRGRQWSVTNIYTGETRLAAEPGRNFSRFSRWFDSTHAVFATGSSDAEVVLDQLVLVDLQSGTSNILGNLSDYWNFDRAIWNATESKSIVFVGDGKVKAASARDLDGEEVIDLGENSWAGAVWYNDDEFFYGKGFNEIRRFNLSTQQDFPVLSGGRDHSYHLLGLISAKALVVASQSFSDGGGLYALELRDLNGLNPREFISGAVGIQYLGSTTKPSW